jgi:tetraacyldisaccharide 4'-kinase
MARPLLLPLTPLYHFGVVLREFRLRHGWEPVKRLRFPVISIGNLSTGGAGKTPFAIALARALAQRGMAVDVLSRGYGRRDRAAARVRPDGTAEEFGDEPLLIAREAGVPVYVARQRYDAGLLAESDAGKKVNPAQVHILDDAYQHRQLHRDVDILLLNREDWEGHLLPAGNLREGRRAVNRASVLAIPADDSELEHRLRSWGWPGPIWRIGRRMDVPAEEGPVFGFCGIARPEQFFAGLERAAGMQLVGRAAFRDHHHYTVRELERLYAAARAAGATALITTAKDRIRLGNLASLLPVSLPLQTAGLRIEIEKEAPALDWLLERVSFATPSGQTL